MQDIWHIVNEPFPTFDSLSEINSITHKVIGICFDVHNELGRGFSESVYKDALEYEFRKREVCFEREKKYKIQYKEIILPHYYYADFVVGGEIILEIKAQQGVIEDHYKQVLNYLAVSKCQLGLLVNFGESSLKFKRLMLSK